MTKVYIYQAFLKSPSGGEDVIYKSKHLHKINEAINQFTKDNNIDDVSGISRLYNLLRFDKYYPKYMTKFTQTPLRDYYKVQYFEKFNSHPDDSLIHTSRYRIYNIYKQDAEMLNDDAKPTRKNIYLSRRNNVISEKMKENKLYPNGIYGDESVSDNESDYQFGKIYKIISSQTDNIYIGSTIQPLSKRLYGHKSAFKRGLKLTSEQILKFDDYQIILIKKFPCNCRCELEDEEKRFIENNKCVNKNKRFRYDKFKKTDVGIFLHSFNFKCPCEV